MAEQQPSVTDELRKLAELKASGVLTDDEFAAAKAALLRVLHAAAPVASAEDATESDKAARAREELEQFKSRFAQASPANLRSLLVEGEDLLIHVCGKERYRSFMTDVGVVEEYLQSARDVGWFKDAVKRKWERQAEEAGDQLKKRVAGIGYRR